MFNALQYTKNLEESGFERDQAEILVRMFMQMIEFNMLSKSDFEKHRSEFGSALEKHKSEFGAALEKHKSEFSAALEKHKSEFGAALEKHRLELTASLEKYRTESNTNTEKLRQEMFHGFEKVDEKLNKFSLQLTIKLGIMLALSVGLLSTILAIKL